MPIEDSVAYTSSALIVNHFDVAVHQDILLSLLKQIRVNDIRKQEKIDLLKGFSDRGKQQKFAANRKQQEYDVSSRETTNTSILE